jgi:hypothetical protein
VVVETVGAVRMGGKEVGSRQGVGSRQDEVSTMRRPFPKVSIHLDVGLHGLDLLHDL